MSRPRLRDALRSRLPNEVPSWVGRVASRLRPRSRPHSVLFVVPGATGGFSRINLELYRDSRAFLGNVLGSSVLEILQDERVRGSLLDHYQIAYTITASNNDDVNHEAARSRDSRSRSIGITALRTMLRVAPDFEVLQPLSTVHRVDGAIAQLVIAR